MGLMVHVGMVTDFDCFQKSFLKKINGWQKIDKSDCGKDEKKEILREKFNSTQLHLYYSHPQTLTTK